jgi:hypothetical protein
MNYNIKLSVIPDKLDSENRFFPYYYLNSPNLNDIINGKYFPKEWISLKTI